MCKDVWHNDFTLLVVVTLNVVFTQRGCGFFPQEENHEETE
jgi:hypothetical protein